MARKPNYRFARLERERNKAARKAERAKLKAERAEQRRREKAGQLAEARLTGSTAPRTSVGAGWRSPDRATVQGMALAAKTNHP